MREDRSFRKFDRYDETKWIVSGATTAREAMQCVLGRKGIVPEGRLVLSASSDCRPDWRGKYNVRVQFCTPAEKRQMDFDRCMNEAVLEIAEY